VLTSPNRSIDLLRGKWRSLATPLCGVIAFLVGVTSVWLGSGVVLTTAAIGTVVPLVTGLVGLALGLGARFPRFEVDNAAKIATGLGGVLYMFIGLTLLVVVVMLAVAPTLVLGQWLQHGYLPSLARMAGSGVLGVLALVVPLATGTVAVRIGARHLQREGIGA